MASSNVIVFIVKPNKRLYVPERELSALRGPQIVDPEMERQMMLDAMFDAIRRAEIRNPAPVGFVRL